MWSIGIQINSRKNILKHIKPFLLIALSLFTSINTAYSQPSINQYSDNAKETAQAIEKKITQYLALKKQGFKRQAPVLAKDYAVPIRNPFSQLSEETYQLFAKKGIDLKAMSKYKTLYIAGTLAGAFSLKIVNADAKTILVLGSGSIEHEIILSRGPVVVLSENVISGGIYTKNLLWMDGNSIDDTVIGLPIVNISRVTNKMLQGNLYTPEEQLQAITELGEDKTHFSSSELQKIKAMLLKEAEKKNTQSHSNAGLSVIVPSADKVIDKERKQYYCRNYAETAVVQNNENIKMKCGFTGLRWNNDQAGQEKWCLGVLDIVSERESRIRAEKLTACHIQAASSDNPDNQLKLPPNCYDPKKKYTPVKSVYAAYRYQRSITQVVKNGLIQYDYNKDGKKDYVYIEQSKKEAQIVVCMSSQTGYQRLPTNMGLDLKEGVINSTQYKIEQNADRLSIYIDLFSHNEGESYRYSSLRYNTVKKVFELVNNDAAAFGIPMPNGEQYPMGLPSVPMVKMH